MPTEANFRALLVNTARQRRDRHDPVAVAARRDAIVAQTVIEHPGWSMFHEELVKIREARRGEMRILETRVAHEDMPALTREFCLFGIRRLAGMIEALNIALNLIPEAVKQGQEAGAGDLA